MRASFPDSDPRKLAREWITRPFRDHVALTRVVSKRDVAADWPFESRNAPSILTEPGQSAIVATGHFARQPMVCLYTIKAIPKKLAALVAGLDQHWLRPRSLRLLLQFGLMVRAIRAIRDGDAEIVHVGHKGTLTGLAKLLKKPDVAVLISSDAFLEQGREMGLHRPFAGSANIDFALGTARLSRLSQRPILVVVPFMDEGAHYIVEWSAPIPPPARDDESADSRITSEILDILERAVGQRPGQYVQTIGSHRRWSEAEQRWVDQAPYQAGADAPSRRQGIHRQVRPPHPRS